MSGGVPPQRGDVPPCNDVAESVVTAIKRQGTFDQVRRMINDSLREDASMLKLEEDAKEAMHRLLSAVPESFSRDQIRQIVRDHLLIGNFPITIQRLAETRTSELNVRDKLLPEVVQKVKESLGEPSEEAERELAESRESNAAEEERTPNRQEEERNSDCDDMDISD